MVKRNEHQLPHRHPSFTFVIVKFRDKWRHEKHKPLHIIRKYTLLKKGLCHDIYEQITYDCNYLLLLLCIWCSLCEVMLQEVSEFPISPGLRTTTPSWQSECQQTPLHHLFLHMWCCLPVTVLQIQNSNTAVFIQHLSNTSLAYVNNTLHCCIYACNKIQLKHYI